MGVGMLGESDHGGLIMAEDDSGDQVTLSVAVEAALDAANHLRPEDGIGVALLRQWAAKLDEAPTAAGFARLLTAMGLTPEGRKNLAVEDKPAAGALSGIRQRRKEPAK